jgi:uncharacterized CHY-type Zn-finger protein
MPKKKRKKTKKRKPTKKEKFYCGHCGAELETEEEKRWACCEWCI